MGDATGSDDLRTEGSDREAVFEHNRRSWNRATRAHESHKRDVGQFLRTGGDTLFDEELDLLGELQGQRLVHLQCNAGQDSLCIARRGAQVLGVDLSDVAIDAARRHSLTSGIEARFESGEVGDFLRTTNERFDIAFASYGALCWLPDLAVWARGVTRVLAPGGRLVLMEFHPFPALLECEGETLDDLRVRYSMDDAAPLLTPGVHDYVAQSGTALTPMGFKSGEPEFVNDEPCVAFDWSTGTILSALLGAGLRLDRYEEFNYANGWKPFPFLEAGDDRRHRFPAGTPEFPLMYGLCASAPSAAR